MMKIVLLHLLYFLCNRQSIIIALVSQQKRIIFNPAWKICSLRDTASQYNSEHGVMLLSPLADRIKLNQELGRYLRSGQRVLADDLVCHMDALNITGTDTVNILLSDSAAKGCSIEITELIFNKYFAADSIRPLRPSVITLNIMIESSRIAEDRHRLNAYLSLYKSSGIPPDKYTYSTLVRSTKNESEILRLLGAAKRANQLTSPLLRASILSLAQRGVDPGDLLQLSSLFEARHAPALCSLSADVIASALLMDSMADAVARKGPLAGWRGCEIASEYVREGHLRISDRGFCALFTHLQRRGRDEPNATALRDEMWTRLVSAIKCGDVKLNGRLSDAYLRCYYDDVRGAIRAWRRDVQPLLVLLNDEQSRREITCKSMESIMYKSGAIGRPDIALEVVVSIRGKNWTVAEKQYLGRAYFHGKNRSMKYGGKSLSKKIGRLLLTGFEQSIELELGVALTSLNAESILNPSRRIRIIL